MKSFFQIVECINSYAKKSKRVQRKIYFQIVECINSYAKLLQKNVTAKKLR